MLMIFIYRKLEHQTLAAKIRGCDLFWFEITPNPNYPQAIVNMQCCYLLLIAVNFDDCKKCILCNDNRLITTLKWLAKRLRFKPHPTRYI